MIYSSKKASYPKAEDIAIGGMSGKRFGQSILRIFQKAVPRIQKTPTKQKAVQVLREEIEREISYLGIPAVDDYGSSIINDIIKNSKVEYKHNKVCVTYRKFKKCMKLESK